MQKRTQDMIEKQKKKKDARSIVDKMPVHLRKLDSFKVIGNGERRRY